jgi:hypothetical protein
MKQNIKQVFLSLYSFIAQCHMLFWHFSTGLSLSSPCYHTAAAGSTEDDDTDASSASHGRWHQGLLHALWRHQGLLRRCRLAYSLLASSLEYTPLAPLIPLQRASSPDYTPSSLSVWEAVSRTSPLSHRRYHPYQRSHSSSQHGY